MLKERMVNAIVQCNHLSKEDIVILEYGLKKTGILLIDTIFTITCGWLLGIVKESILFQIAFMLLRMLAGGYHAKSELQCEVQSLMVTVVSLICIREISFMVWWGYVIMLLVSGFIAVKAPVEAENRPLSDDERRINHSRSVVIIVLINVLAGICVCFQWKMFWNSLFVVIIVEMGLMGMGLLKR